MRKLSIYMACVLVLCMALPMTGMAAGSLPMATVPPQGAQSAAGDVDTADEGDMAMAEDDAAEPTANAAPTPTPEPTAAPVVNASFGIEPQLGYDGLLMIGRWSPAFVTITNNGADFDGFLGVNAFSRLTQYDRYEIPLTIASGATKRVLLPFKPMARQDMYAFELTVDGKIVAEKRVAPAKLVSTETMTIGVLSDSAEALSYINQRANGVNTLRGEVWTTVPLTAETFPETDELMGAFTMLVVDGVDARTLSDAQQRALTAWLLKGGYVFISGGAKAATGYPFFSTWTELAPGQLKETEDITPALLSYATVKGQPAEASFWLNALPGQGAIAATDEGDGLIVRHRAGEGFLYSMAFDLADAALVTWPSMTAILPRLLRQNIPTEYNRLLNRQDELRYGYNDVYQVREVVNTLSIPNEESGLPVVLILAAYLLVVGFGGYFLLKRFDRREWLWVAAPVSAVVFALLLFGLSRASTMNTPVALTASRVIFEGEDAQYNAYLGVATPNDGELLIQTDQKQLPQVISEDSYWYDENSNQQDRLFRPLNLRQRYRLGQSPSIGFASSNAWEARMLKLSGMETEAGSLTGNVWMEADGLHGEAINNTAYTIREAIVITGFGYCKLGDVMPGQTVAFAMRYPDKPIDMSSPDFKAQPDVMYSTLDMTFTGQSYYYDNSINTYMSAALYKDQMNATTEERRRMSLVQMFEQDWAFYENRSSFYFFGFNDTIAQIAVALNGEPVTRTAHTAVIGSRMTFEPIGPTGEVMYPQGIISAEVLVDQGEDKKARVATEDDVDTTNNNMYGGNSNTYLNLAAPAAIRFMLPRFEAYNIEKMTLAGMSYETLPTMYLYNNDTGKWDEQLLLSVAMTGDEWKPYIDDEGGVYVRYVPGEGANRYESMSMPTIALKGEVK